MSKDVSLDRQRLRDARDALAAAKAAFENAVDINNDLEEAIGTPHGKSKLRDRVGWFEANWSGNREDLTKMVAKVHEGLTEIVDAWEQWEIEAAASFETN